VSFLNTQKEFDTPEAALEHFGVKGMKWGVRKGYTSRISNKAAAARRVSEGKASVVDKVRIHGTTSSADFIKGGGFKGGARVRADRDEAHVQRINEGKATTLDLIKLYGGARITDIRTS
jgi:hypothetical protein